MPQQLIERIFNADGALDLDGFMAVVTDNVRLRIGSQPPIVGQPAVRQVIAGLFAGMRQGIRHRLHEIWGTDNQFAYEAAATFYLKDGRDVDLPYTNVLRLDASQRVCDYRIYIDLAPLMSQTSAVVEAKQVKRAALEFKPANAAILLVDHQEKTMNWIKSQPQKTTLANVRMLARLGTEVGIPLIVTTTMEDEIGPTIEDIRELAPEAHERRIRRGGVFNCFLVPEFADAVAQTGRKNLIIAGLTTDVCVFNTAKGAREAGYDVAVVADGCGSASALAADITFSRLRDIGVDVTAGNQILTGLFETFDTPEGKKAEIIGFQELISHY